MRHCAVLCLVLRVSNGRLRQLIINVQRSKLPSSGEATALLCFAVESFVVVDVQAHGTRQNLDGTVGVLQRDLRHCHFEQHCHKHKEVHFSDLRCQLTEIEAKATSIKVAQWPISDIRPIQNRQLKSTRANQSNTRKAHQAAKLKNAIDGGETCIQCLE